MGNCCVVDEHQEEIQADVKYRTTNENNNGESNQKLQFRAVNMNRNYTGEKAQTKEDDKNELNFMQNTEEDEEIIQSTAVGPTLQQGNLETKKGNVSNKNEKPIFTTDRPVVVIKEEVKTVQPSNDDELKAQKKREEDKEQRRIFIEDFYTERLRAAEKRVGQFDSLNNSRKYNIHPTRLTSIIDNPNLTEIDLLIIDNDTIYWGQTNRLGHREGYGVLLKRGGIKTEGYWETNHLEVYGRHIDVDGLVSEGSYSNGILSGDGLESSETYEYVGQFDNGKKHGYGEYSSKKDIYHGEFKEGKRNGKGKLTMLPDKHEYQGDFVNGRLDGKGTFRWNYGDVYDGDFKKNKLDGYGTYTWKNGDVYVGAYVDGNKKGFGKMVWKDGKVYEGEFKDNKPVKA